MFELDETQQEMFYKWNRDHKKLCSVHKGTIGGRLAYKFTPTSLGVIVIAGCACGEKIDLTDYDKW